MAREGMDVELGRSQANQLQSHVVDQIQQAIHSLNGLTEQIALNWTGPDSTQFHGDWMSRLMPQLNTVLQALLGFHTEFLKNIEEQLQASGGGGSTASPGIFDGPIYETPSFVTPRNWSQVFGDDGGIHHLDEVGPLDAV